VSYGQPQVNDNGDIVFVSISELPYKLGRVYCANRPMCLMHTTGTNIEKINKITSDEFSARSPRFVPKSRKIVYFQRAPYGPHSECESIMIYDLGANSNRELVPVVKEYPKSDDEFSGIFTGIYGDQFLSDPFITVDNQPVLMISTVAKNTVASLGEGYDKNSILRQKS